MFHLRRFRWKRRRAALALLPATALMAMMGLAGAATGTGSFKARWRALHTGVFEANAIAGGNEVARTGRSRGTRVNVYRPAGASYYGPGLYGNSTACGKTLTPSTLGVANRTLPCGTRVTLRYHGRTVTVPVIDRGPFSGSREYDLTAATKAELGFGSTGTVLTTR
ncbi:MAG: septal ring lytic transglycosylase RlpA family protein [Solirubrobacterales bacterium]